MPHASLTQTLVLLGALSLGAASVLAAPPLQLAGLGNWPVENQRSAPVQREPLLMPGKKTLHQRVLTRPGALLVPQPGVSEGRPQPTFSRFYVYQRRALEGQEWLQIGLDDRGTVSGWMAAVQTVPWRQQLVLAFTNPSGRQRALFFAKREGLQTVLEADDGPERSARLLQGAVSGKPSDVVVAVEPETHIDIHEQFYLLPILASDETYTASGHTALLLEVASVSETRAHSDIGTELAVPETLRRGFKGTIVFVIDSTISMGPYIERTKEAVANIYAHIEAAKLLDRVKFGLVAYRSSVGASPGLGYLAKEFVDPLEVEDGRDFLSRVSALRPAAVSSAAFDEDAYAGVMTALEGVEWPAFGARYIILVTDAGALRGDHPLSGTGLDAGQLRLEIDHRGIALYVLHIKTPQGVRNHRSAESQYRLLSHYPHLAEPLYYPVETGRVDQFGFIVDRLSEALVSQLGAAVRGGGAPGVDVHAGVTPSDDQQRELARRIREDAADLGYAMQLAYLGRVQGTQAPAVFRGWITDADLQDPGRRAVAPHILLTKQQLNDMQLVLKGIADAASQAMLSPDQFYDKLRSFAAVMGRDPNTVVGSNATRIADMGLLGEYLDGLPYKSDVMHLDSDTWSRWSIQQQAHFLDSVQRKMRLYDIYHSDADRWVSLAEGSDPAQHVYPVPLDALP